MKRFKGVYTAKQCTDLADVNHAIEMINHIKAAFPSKAADRRWCSLMKRKGQFLDKILNQKTNSNNETV